MGYLKDTIRGIEWMGGLRVATRVIAFLKIAILARILLPDEFGLFGVAALVLSLLETFTETGINIFLIQLKTNFEEYINTAWVVSIARGLLISLLIFISTPFISKFFNLPNVIPLLYLISAVPLIKGLINPSVTRFQKELMFNKEFWFRSVIYLADAFVVITLALLTKTAISFVWGLVAGAIVEVVASFIFIKPLPKLIFNKKKVKNIINRGKWVTGYGIFDYLYQNIDDAIVGKLLGATPLGIYQVAYKISSLPVSEVAEVVSKVTFPVYVKISLDAGRLKKAFSKTVATSSLLMILVGTVIFIFPKEIVTLILGTNWLNTISIIRILAVFGVIRGIVGIPLSLFLAVNKQEYVTVVTTGSLLIMMLVIFPLINAYGVNGAAYSALIGSFCSLILSIFFTRKIFKK